MRHILPITSAAILAVSVPLAAQEDHFTASPQGYEAIEGNQSIDLIGKEALLRYQQIDSLTLGAKTSRKRFAFRRDGLLPVNPAYAARVVDIELTVGEGNLATASTTFDDNYLAGTKTVVMARKNVSWPDWIINPVVPPQPEPQWAILVLDAPPWTYGGKAATGNDFVWEVRVWGNDHAGAAYPMDADTAMPTVLQGATSGVGTGCTTVGQTGAMTITADNFNHGTKLALRLGVGRSAPNQPVTFLFGAQQQLMTLPGFCANLQILPIIGMPLGSTDAVGALTTMIDPIAYNPMLVGMAFYAQGVVMDPNQVTGLALTPGRKSIVASDPPTGPGVKHLWALDPDATVATSGLVNGGIILHTNEN
jgi:hypothetical protein